MLSLTITPLPPPAYDQAAPTAQTLSAGAYNSSGQNNLELMALCKTGSGLDIEAHPSQAAKSRCQSTTLKAAPVVLAHLLIRIDQDQGIFQLILIQDLVELAS